MSTGIIACLGPSQRLKYVADTDCRVVLNCSATSTGNQVSINGAYIFAAPLPAYEMFAQHELYLAAGQSIGIVTEVGGSCIVSCYEG